MNRNSINIYRAISCEEKLSIEKSLAFIPHADHMAGKWFAEKIDDAAKWGRLFYNWDKKPFFIVLIQLPKHIAELMIKHPRLNGIGPSRYAEGDVLKNVNESILKIEFLPYIPLT
jgi:hypothetical protein